MPLSLEQVVDRVEIIETVNKFSWAIDTQRPPQAMLSEVFVPDMQFGLSREPLSIGSSDAIKLMPMGLDAFAGFIEKIQGKYSATQHHNTNSVVTFTGEGTAFVKTYAANFHVKQDKDGGGHFDFHGVYEDEMIKTPEGWRIKARKQYPFYIEGSPAPDPA